ncbi:hypothetical protein [Rhodospirillum centenum]|uniref:GcrA cell cycle regulator n=1 Tax=Rhodospirillum centenum (strain ATCC 51521 / SW) TaxID=414684 RepID=B6IUC2_RHOCS|nr:hypothetical protein [Rhodospirillum centenum]ACJ00102.1 hypothetical protein RC1_2727 [Rhodospirillum centenum SW]
MMTETLDAPPPVPANDALIRTLYLGGANTIEISRQLGLGISEVIGRIRALDLRPPSMGVRRSPEARAPEVHGPEFRAPEYRDDAVSAADLPGNGAAPGATGLGATGLGAAAPVSAALAPSATVLPPARPAPALHSAGRPAPRPGAALHAAEKARPAVLRRPALDALDDEDEDDEPRATPGRPRGWLMPEDQVEAMFLRSGQRFQDVQFRRRA